GPGFLGLWRRGQQSGARRVSAVSLRARSFGQEEVRHRGHLRAEHGSDFASLIANLSKQETRMDGSPRIVDELRNLPTLDALQAPIGARKLAPGLIKRPKPILWKEMRSDFVPAHWRYTEAKAAMQAAGRLIGTDLAERRNFVMRNPIPGNDIAT